MKEEKKAEISQVTVAIIIILALALIGLYIIGNNLLSFKDTLGS